MNPFNLFRKTFEAQQPINEQPETEPKQPIFDPSIANDRSFATLLYYSKNACTDRSDTPILIYVRFEVNAKNLTTWVEFVNAYNRGRLSSEEAITTFYCNFEHYFEPVRDKVIAHVIINGTPNTVAYLLETSQSILNEYNSFIRAIAEALLSAPFVTKNIFKGIIRENIEDASDENLRLGFDGIREKLRFKNTSKPGDDLEIYDVCMPTKKEMTGNLISEADIRPIQRILYRMFVNGEVRVVYSKSTNPHDRYLNSVSTHLLPHLLTEFKGVGAAVEKRIMDILGDYRDEDDISILQPTGSKVTINDDGESVYEGIDEYVTKILPDEP